MEMEGICIYDQKSISLSCSNLGLNQDLYREHTDWAAARMQVQQFKWEV